MLTFVVRLFSLVEKERIFILIANNFLQSQRDLFSIIRFIKSLYCSKSKKLAKCASSGTLRLTHCGYDNPIFR